ncbi:hypothetical protein [Ahrensia sp. R2A130]|uniref:hypothetical protein n=1 Tax=Ahrensia sp. R2A130 TaxID=744979 RepID=UPI0001E0E0AE|nr:hypothetical protein [Ahrensia sp. R2A130]EFL89338.1 GCN5-related N-acetyltransferase [Ahrensia sp. R2A130]
MPSKPTASLFQDHDVRAALEQRWLALTRQELPSVAAQRGWPIHLDHCFQRVLLDAACSTVWYDVITSRPAYRAAPDDLLNRAVDLAENVLNGEMDISELNRQSLRYRGKVG